MGSYTSSEECEVQLNIQNISVSERLFSPVDNFVMTVVVPIILGLGVITNLTLVFVFLRVPRLRSETDVYLANLALADVIFLIVNSAYNIRIVTVSPLLRHEPFSNSAGCTIFNFVRGTSYAASIAQVTMVSFERYLALCHPIQHLKLRRRRRIYKMVAICWGIGMVFSGLTTLNYAKYNASCLQWPEDDIYIGFPSKISFCSQIFKWTKYICKPLLEIPWCIAMVGNIYMYVCIILALNKRKGVNSNGETGKAYAKARQIRNQVAKMLIVNGLVFFVCQAPFALINLTEWILLLVEDVENPIGVFFIEYSWVTFIPLQINSVVNPLVYCAFNSQYRAAFTEAFGCSSRPRRHMANSVPAVRNTENCETKL